MVAGKMSSGSILPEIKGSNIPNILDIKSISVKKNASIDRKKVIRKASGAAINAKMANCNKLSG